MPKKSLKRVSVRVKLKLSIRREFKCLNILATKKDLSVPLPETKSGRLEAAALLTKSKEQILYAWEASAREKVNGARKQSSQAIRDSIPKFIDELVKTLLSADPKDEAENAAAIAREHANDRLSQGEYTLDEVIYEYHLLRTILVEVLESKSALGAESSKIIHEYLDRGIRKSAVEYAEAAARHELTRKTEQEEARKIATSIHSKKTEAARAELYEFFMQCPIPTVILTGPEYHFALANPPYETFIGRKASGKAMFEVYSQAEVADYLPVLDAVYKTGTPYFAKEQPFNLPDANGVIRNLWTNISYYPFRGAESEIRGILAYVQDVTEQVQARKRAEESENQFRQISDSLSLMIWIANPDGIIYWANKWWYNYTGCDHLDWTGTRSPLHPLDIPEGYKRWLESMNTGCEFNVEMRFKRSVDDAYRWHLVQAVAIRDQNEKIIKWVGSSVEIDEQKNLVRDLETERDLRERFVTALTHDLRNPLTAAKLNAEVLHGKPNDPESVKKITLRIIRSIDRGESMVRDMLDANRMKAGQGISVSFSECVLEEVVNKTLSDLQTISGRNFEFRNESGHIQGYWDGEGLRRIIENLAGNAMKYGTPNGAITVRILKEANYAEISVHNEGAPITPAEQITLFESYHRSDSAIKSGEKGWGIGLTVVKGIAEAHHGTVRVESDAGTGTTFFVRMPIDSRILS